MVFREPARQHARGSVRYGPFPVRTRLLIFSFAALLTAIVLTFVALDRDRLVCTPGARCSLSNTLRTQIHTFPTAAIGEVRVDVRSNSKGVPYGVIVLSLAPTQEFRLSQTSVEEANAVAARIRARLAAGQKVDVEVGGSWWVLALAGAALLLCFSLVAAGLRGFGVFQLDIPSDRSRLRVQRRLLGIPVSTHEVSLEGVTDVLIEGGALDDAWRGRDEAPTPAGRLVLVDAWGAVRPVTSTVFPGAAVHLRAACALRAILGMVPQRGGVEEHLASLPWITTSPGMRAAFSFIGATLGALLGIGLVAVGVLLVGGLQPSDSDTWVFAVGAVLGAPAGVVFALFVTRTRPPT
ncbi:hypothetical protein [Chondromyces crocatus]|uniref:Uncharacterized protein n=1 Tax=Chondromyces crocatus TaxID=52 RepID=A0A0K1EID5_CHOCO|nr:hypothetical protein [Chondromyces crocatus]AKT40621.1 uncharacterized protein CMC5_047770 [Chondromyces crocatus]